MSTNKWRVPGLAHQVTESTLDHKLKGLSCACRVACNHWTARHNRTDRCSTWIQTLGSDLRTISLFRLCRKSFNESLTLKARSFAVKMPLKPSSSSTTKTQSVRLAAQSWLASATVILSGTVNAGLGFNAATVPFAPVILDSFLFRRLFDAAVEIVRLRASSDSIFLRIAWLNEGQCEHRDHGNVARLPRRTSSFLLAFLRVSIAEPERVDMWGRELEEGVGEGARSE